MENIQKFKEIIKNNGVDHIKFLMIKEFLDIKKIDKNLIQKTTLLKNLKIKFQNKSIKEKPFFNIKNLEDLEKNLEDILTFNEILKECKTQPLNLFLQEIILALIFKNETEFLSQLFDLYYEEIFTSISWSSSTMHAISLIALSIINTENNNTKRARYNIELIKFDKIELSYENYITLFYYFTILKISFKDGIKSENKIASRKIKNLTKTLGFKRFLNVSNQYIIN